MKQFFAKINRGILLTALVVLSIALYLAVTAGRQAQEKPQIEEICRQYVAAEIRYSLLPAAFRSDGEAIRPEQLDAYMLEMEAALRPLYIKNERIQDLAIQRLKDSLIRQAEGWAVIQNYEKTIKDFDSFSFSGSEVTVIFKTQSTIERTGAPADKMPGGRIAGETTDTMVLQKEGGRWLVVYASLYEPSGEIRY